MPTLAEVAHQLRADEAGAADDHDFHFVLSAFVAE
jgi:hypothetical protein